MKKFAWAALILCIVSGCGVKKPPIAPQRIPEPPLPLHLDCSPNDETCDLTDENYKPRR